MCVFLSTDHCRMSSVTVTQVLFVQVSTLIKHSLLFNHGKLNLTVVIASLQVVSEWLLEDCLTER